MKQKTEINKTNLVEVLELFFLNYGAFKSRNAGEIMGIIRAAYKKCALKYHPDKNKGPEAEEQFKEISNAYQLFCQAYENGSFELLFSADSLKTSEIGTEVKKSSAITVSWSFPDSIKNSLYAYYDGRYGNVNDLPGAANEKLRSMLVKILGISSFGFWVEFSTTNSGYVVKSSQQYTINVISEFLTTISDYALECLKPMAFHYEITMDNALLVCKTSNVDCDQITLAIKRAMMLENTSSIITIQNENKYQIYIKSNTPSLIPEFLGKPLAIPSQTQEATLAQALKQPSPLIAKSSTIQLAFALDVTGSMSSMLSAAKQSLRKAGISIQESQNEAPDMFVVTYHDYSDEGKPLGGRFDRGSRFDGGSRFSSGSRFEEPSEIKTTSLTADENEAPKEEKLQEALNYPGKRDEHKRPVFTSPVIVSNILDAVGAEGGGDTPEMLEAALAVTTQLSWSAPVRTLYLALDAPPHFHYNGISSGDSYSTLDAIKTAQADLKHDPILKSATDPQDWFTQILILAKQGVKINPMVCTTSKDVVFMATFIATITGGAAFIIQNSQWESRLSSVIQDSTLLDVKEANPMAIMIPTKSADHSDMRPDSAYYAAVMEIFRSINIKKLFEVNCDIKQLAQEVRNVYSKQINLFLLNQKTYSGVFPDGYLSMANDIRYLVLGARNPVLCINEPKSPTLVKRSSLVMNGLFNETDQQDFELTKTKFCVFITFKDGNKAHQFYDTHKEHIYPVWDTQNQQRLPFIDSDRISDHFVIRISISWQDRARTICYTYQNFCIDTKLNLPTLEKIREETRSYVPPVKVNNSQTQDCCVM